MHSSIAANFSNGRFVIELFQDFKRGAGIIFFWQDHVESHFKSLSHAVRHFYGTEFEIWTGWAV